MAEDTRKNILDVDVVQSIDKTDTVLVNDNNSLKQVSVETLVSSGIPDQYVTESELTGKGYATTSDLPTKISDLSNDSGFITNDDIPQKLPNPQKIIFTGAVSVEYDGTTQQTVNIPNSGGSGGSYTLPIMSSSQLGGGKAVEKTTEDVPVAVDPETGQLFVPTYPENSGSVDPEQIKQAVNGYLEKNPVQPTPVDKTLTKDNEAADAKITGEKLSEKIDKQKGVKFENIGFAKVYRYGRSYFNGNIPEEGTAVAPLGQIIQCEPGETLYCNFKLSPYQTSNQRVTVINYVPDKNFGQFPSKSICGYIEQQESGIYKIPEDFTDAKAAFFPAGSMGNNQLGYYDRNSRYAVQNVSFDEIPKSYIQEEIVPYPQSEGLIVDTDKSMMLYASLFKAVSPMVGAKVYVSGDSITAQSSTLLNNTTSDDFGKGWYDRIGIKYIQQYECHGYEGNRWYSTGTLKNSAVADIKKIIEAGVVYDYIVLEWGTNDIWSGASFGSADDVASDADNAGTVAAIRWCIENLQSNFPSTRIIVIMPCMRNGNARQEQYYTLVDSILKSYGVRRVYMAYDSGITLSMMAPDGIHFRYQDIDGTHKQNMIGLEKYSKCLEAEMIKA